MVKQSSYQCVWQSVSLAEQPGDEHTKIREPSILSHSRKKKQSFMPVNFRGWNVLGGWVGGGGGGGPPTEDTHRATLNIFFSSFFLTPLCLSSITAFLTPSLWRKIQIQTFEKAVDYMKNLADFHIEMRCSFCALWKIWCRTDYSTEEVLAVCALTGLGWWIAGPPQRLQFTNSGFIHFDLLLPSTVNISFEL